MHINKQELLHRLRIIVDDAGGVVEADDETLPPNLRSTEGAYVVAWDEGDALTVVGVRSYLGVPLKTDEATEIAMDWRAEVGWYAPAAPSLVVAP